MKAKYYKNLILSSSGVLFDIKTRKIYILEQSWIDDFNNLLSGKINKSESFFEDYIEDEKKLINNNTEILVLKINMTNFCNLRCKYCFANEGTYNKKKQAFSKELVDSLILFVKNYPSIKYITFFGGEPLLNYRAMKEICEKITVLNKNIQFLCQTNGTIVDENIVDLLNKYNFNVTLSVDGKKEDNDRNRVDKNGKGTFDVVRRNYGLIQPSIKSIEATYDKHSKMSKIETADFLYKEFNCNNIAVCDLLKGKERNFNIDQEIENFVQKPYTLSNEVTSTIINFFSRNNTTRFCSAGSHLIQIDSDGTLYPCHLLIDKGDKYKLGNIQNFDVDTFNKKRNEFIKILEKDNYVNCKNCIASWTCAKCYAENEEIVQEDCIAKQNRMLELFEELGIYIKKEGLNYILKKLENAVSYV